MVSAALVANSRPSLRPYPGTKLLSLTSAFGPPFPCEEEQTNCQFHELIDLYRRFKIGVP